MSEYEDLVNARMDLESAIITYMKKIRNHPCSVIDPGDTFLITADYIVEAFDGGSVTDLRVNFFKNNSK